MSVEFGKRLQAARKEKGYTQQYVADILGVERSTYAHWERGSAEPPIEHIRRLADLFRVSVDHLMGRDKKAGEVVALNRGKLPPNLPPEAKEEYERLMEYLEWKYGNGPKPKER